MKKEMKDSTANTLVIGGTTVMLLIAGLPLTASLGILGATIIGCAYITCKNNKEK